MKLFHFLLIAIVVIGGCSAPKNQEEPPEEQATAKTQIDHIMVGVFDLDSGVALLKEMTGVEAVYGGIHPGRDTRNSLLSLGNNTYFELLAPQADLDTVTNPLAEVILELKTPTPIHWAVSTTDIEATWKTVKELGWNVSDLDSGGREKPDGTKLSWRNFWIEDESGSGAIPFFIEWGEGSVHPSQTSAEGCNFSKLVIHTSMTDKLSQLAETLDLKIEVVESDEESLQLVLDCGENEVTL